MQLVVHLYIIRRPELTVRSRIEDLPVKLLAGDLHLQLARRHVQLDLGPGVASSKVDPQVEREDERGWNQQPCGLREAVAGDVGRAASITATEQERESQERADCQDKPSRRDVIDQA